MEKIELRAAMMIRSIKYATLTFYQKRACLSAIFFSKRQIEVIGKIPRRLGRTPLTGFQYASPLNRRSLTGKLVLLKRNRTGSILVNGVSDY